MLLLGPRSIVEGLRLVGEGGFAAQEVNGEGGDVVIAAEESFAAVAAAAPAVEQETADDAYERRIAWRLPGLRAWREKQLASFSSAQVHPRSGQSGQSGLPCSADPCLGW